MRRAWARWLMLAALTGVLAGCSGPAAVAPGPPAPPAGSLALDAATAPGLYALDHAGGPLWLRLDGVAASVAVYDARDQRVASLRLGADPGAAGPVALHEGTVADVPRGEVVLLVDHLDGALAAGPRPTGPADRSGEEGARLPLRPLGADVERIPLADTGQPFGLQGLFGADVPPTAFNVTGRPPLAMRVLVHGYVASLRVQVAGPLGPVLEAEGAAGRPLRLPLLDDGVQFQEVPATFHPENASGGGPGAEAPALQGTVEATRLEGLAVLEVVRYSRARESARAEPGPSGPPSFRYGIVGPDPAWVEVAADATALVLYAEAAGAAPDPASADAAGATWASVFGPDDRKLATVRVPAGASVAVPVAGGGRYVVAPLGGTVGVGADRLGGDFEVHPLEWAETLVAPPEGRPYGMREADAQVPGVPYRALAAWTRPSQALGLGVTACASETVALLRQAGETVAANGTQARSLPEHAVAALLDGGPLRVAGDAVGGGCQEAAFVVHSYVRPMPAAAATQAS